MIHLNNIFISVSDPFHFNKHLDPRIRFQWLWIWMWMRIRIRGNFNSVNLVFTCFVKFIIYINFTYLLYIPNVTKKSTLQQKKDLTKKLKYWKKVIFSSCIHWQFRFFYDMVLVSFRHYTRIRIRIVWNGFRSDQMIPTHTDPDPKHWFLIWIISEETQKAYPVGWL